MLIETIAGAKAPITAVDARYYEFAGDKTAGNCSIRIHNVSHQDEGNWRLVCTLIGNFLVFFFLDFFLWIPKRVINFKKF